MMIKTLLRKVDSFTFNKELQAYSEADVLRVLKKDYCSLDDFKTLISKSADSFIEEMARKAKELNTRNFGKAVLLYTPLYISNHCVNKCLYCGFNIDNGIKRSKLSLQEIDEEAKKIASTGLKHILLLTGESPKDTPMSYLKDAISILSRYFDSISIEVHALSKADYQELVEAGVDGLTIYQEIYNEKTYEKYHVSGPKSDYDYRLDAPERAILSGIHSVNIGSLIGLGDWREEGFKTAMHLDYLFRKFPHVEYGVSVPRMRDFSGEFKDVIEIKDQDFVKLMLAYKIVFPRVSLNLSTRESENFRNNMMKICVNKVSAGVSTSVGDDSENEQFFISDERSVESIYEDILALGYQPVFRDFVNDRRCKNELL